MMVTWSIRPENFKAAIARFKEKGSTPGKGVKLLGRWHEMGTGGGFALFEVTDPAAFTVFVMGYSDLADQKAVPVVEDADIASIL